MRHEAGGWTLETIGTAWIFAKQFKAMTPGAAGP
jgi:hypothetical protein